jgi:DNA-binding NarL/FixJ family response regulator
MTEMNSPEKISVLIADDHALVREAWSYVLNSHPLFTVVAQCSNAEEAIEKAKELRPKAVLMDINLPGMDGIEATRQIRKYSPGSKILGVSLHSQPVFARKMMKAGALGYITKNSSKEEMFKAIQEVVEGRTYVCKEIKNILTEQIINGEESNKGINALSSREMEIIDQIIKGNSSKEIALNLNIALKTVEVHRYNISKKLNLKNAASLVNLMHNNPQLNFSNN